MAKIEHSIPGLLKDRAEKQPDDVAYTFVDYEVDAAGYSESLTWSEVYDRVQVVAATLAKCGSPGDRAVILAPQSMEYVLAFLGCDPGRVHRRPVVDAADASARRAGHRGHEGFDAGRGADHVGGRRRRQEVRSGRAEAAGAEVHRGRHPGLRLAARSHASGVAAEDRLSAVHVGFDQSGRPAWSSTMTTSSSMSVSCSPTTTRPTPTAPRRTPRSCRGCPSTTTWDSSSACSFR